MIPLFLLVVVLTSRPPPQSLFMSVGTANLSERCSSKADCVSGLDCLYGACVASDCVIKVSLSSKNGVSLVCAGAGDCNATWDASSNTWSGKCTCWDSNRVAENTTTQSGTTVGICSTCNSGYTAVDWRCVANACMLNSKECSGHGTCASNGKSCACDSGFYQTTLQYNGEAKIACATDTCGNIDNQFMCIDLQTNNVVGQCFGLPDEEYRCLCRPGFRGIRANHQKTGCISWNCFPMDDGRICGPFNGGDCVLEGGKYGCKCLDGFVLTPRGCIPSGCAPTEHGIPCLGAGSCRLDSGSQTWGCNCLQNYEETQKGCISRRCQPSVSGVTCHGHGVCEDNLKCKCDKGYSGIACSTPVWGIVLAVLIPLAAATAVAVAVPLVLRRKRRRIQIE
ncbi:High cysteine membrane protein [Giardia muris]|uniref:High cysteine membrane protein n=1 Tax=Giardia muris TaxID=5742 RepID=A0A4Z1TCA6_GIAMU|nr:High cysteine membrane protein [Giardia muris]|eukprot:TNJ30111.1 High cysteine membrane protein [Giardia muris]